MLTLRAGVVGSPISHSLSPVLHRAAYAALGLAGWRYDAVEVPAGALAEHVASLGPEWVGLSVTMPGKEEALALSAVASEHARLTGAANTLMRRPDGWHADNTDVHGLAMALTEAGLQSPQRVTIVGGGATARSAVVAVRRLGASRVGLVVRDRPRPDTLTLAGQLGLDPEVRTLDAGPVVLDSSLHDAVISTLPGGAPAPQLSLGPPGSTAPVVLDVTYAPWPSPLATAVRALGPGAPPVASGLGMLLHQAARQVHLITGHDGPVEAMRDALGPGEGIDG